MKRMVLELQHLLQRMYPLAQPSQVRSRLQELSLRQPLKQLLVVYLLRVKAPCICTSGLSRCQEKMCTGLIQLISFAHQCYQNVLSVFAAPTNFVRLAPMRQSILIQTLFPRKLRNPNTIHSVLKIPMSLMKASCNEYEPLINGNPVQHIDGEQDLYLV